LLGRFLHVLQRGRAGAFFTKFCRNLRAASGSLSIIAAASSLSENAIQDVPPTSVTNISAADKERGMWCLFIHSTTGLSA
jgi:hypothetical protein